MQHCWSVSTRRDWTNWSGTWPMPSWGWRTLKLRIVTANSKSWAHWLRPGSRNTDASWPSCSRTWKTSGSSMPRYPANASARLFSSPPIRVDRSTAGRCPSSTRTLKYYYIGRDVAAFRTVHWRDARIIQTNWCMLTVLGQKLERIEVHNKPVVVSKFGRTQSRLSNTSL